jgi:hypothetical protein
MCCPGCIAESGAKSKKKVVKSRKLKFAYVHKNDIKYLPRYIEEANLASLSAFAAERRAASGSGPEKQEFVKPDPGSGA